VTSAITAKADLRTQMRGVRRSVDDAAGRSERIWATVRQLPAMRSATTVMVFASVPGEPDTAPFVTWCRSHGKVVVMPEEAPEPTGPDVVVVPGIAFATDGHRLGQGGGWYDRFLAAVRDDCVTIGVAFAPQIVTELPVEPHDVVLDVVVTDEGVVRGIESR
jgi:5-formyltetrahydrofolate cyclo-ligase